MGNTHINARISNFIHRQIATIGENRAHSARNTTTTLGIRYEPMALPHRATRKVQ